MGVSIPQPFDADISGSLGSVGPVTIAGGLGAVGPVTVAGIPDTYTINIGTLPQIDLKLEPITLNPVTLNPVTLDLNVAIKELPSIRAHIPANFSVGLSLLGMDVLCVRLCGEAQLITEPYVRNPCECCGEHEPQPRRVGAGSVIPLNG